MKHKNLKKLMFLMVLMLGVGQAAQATRVYADLASSQAFGEAQWDVNTNTFTWQTQTNAYMILEGLSGDLSDYTNLVIETAEYGGQSYRVDIILADGTTLRGNQEGFADGSFYSAGTKTIDLTQFTDEQTSQVTEIRISTNYSENGSIVLNYAYLEKPFELTFNNAGQAYIYPTDMAATGMTIDPQGVITKDAAGDANITIELGDVDFSKVKSIIMDIDTTSASGYTDLISNTVIKTQEGTNVGDWWSSKYGISDYTQYQATSSHVKSIIMYADYSKTGSMKINSICITKDVISANPGGEVDLLSIPYLVQEENNWNVGTPEWNVGKGEQNTIYGRGDTKPSYYADLSEYDELHIYQTMGAPVRVFFFNNTTDGYDTEYPTKVEGQEYSTVNLKAIKEKYGFAKLIAIKASAYNTFATVEKIAAIQSNPAANYVLSGKGDMTAATEAALADANATAIDATGLTNTEVITLESANPNCLFIVSDAAKLANAKNVLVKGEDGTYACANLELTPGYPFHAPYEFTAAEAKTQKTVNEGGHSTLVLPYEAAMPDGCEAYTVTGVNEQNKLEGTAIRTIPANKPVLLENAGTYEFSANNVKVAATAAELTNGILTGVYDNSTKTPVGSYALQTQGDVQAFYHATSEEVAPTMTPFTAYLTDDASNQANVNRLIFDFEDNDVTGIEQVEAAAKAAATVVEIYDLSGRKVSAPVKGINLMKMSDGTVKKVIVK